ncbi:MAG TPA: ABC transporter permease [Terriglobales bacterium]|nr:ABC transporter permease [Terriglobales bacterium]
MNAIGAMLYREAKIRTTNLTFIFWDLFYPLCYMLVFGVGINSALGSPEALAGVDYNAFFLGGVLAMASFGIAANTSWSFFLDRDNGIFFEMLTYPLGRGSYLLGKVAFNICVSMLQAIITLALAALLFRIPLRWHLLPLLFLGMAIGTAGWFFFYSIFALKTRRNDIFNSVTSIFYFVFLFASSMFYPLDPLPKWFRAIAAVNPITWQIDWFRYTSIGLGEKHQVALEALGFLVFVSASFVYAAYSLRQQE